MPAIRFDLFACLLFLLLAAWPESARAGRIAVDDAAGTSPTRCNLAQAIYTADLAANGGPAPYGSTPPGSTTLDPLLAWYYSNPPGGSCTIVADGRQGYTIDLAAIAGQTILLRDPASSWYGWSLLPAIAADITIEGHGVTLYRATSWRARFFFVGADPTSSATPGYSTPGAGRLTLRNLSLRGGVAAGHPGNSGGGGAGMGGAIYNQGTLHLAGVTLFENSALGGSNHDPNGYNDGGGMSYSEGDANGMGLFVTVGAGDAGSPVVTGSTQGQAGGGVPNGMGGRGGASLGCCGVAGGSGGAGGNGSGGGGGGGGTVPFGNIQKLLYGGAGGGGFGGGPGGAGVMGGTGEGSGAGGAFGYIGSHGYQVVHVVDGRAGGGGGGGVGSGGPGDTGGQIGGGGGGGFGGGGGSGSESVIATVGGDGGFGGGGGGNGATVWPFPMALSKGGYGGGDGAGSVGGGGGAGMGGAIFNHGGTATLLNSTIAANSTYVGETRNLYNAGGSALGAGIFNLNGSVTLSYSTIATNAGRFLRIGPEDPHIFGDAVFSVAYNGAAITGSARASLVIDNSLIIEAIDSFGANALVADQPAGVSGGLANVAISQVQATGTNLVSSANTLNAAAPMPAFAFTGMTAFSPLQANGAPASPMTLMPQEARLFGTTNCIDAWGNPVLTDQRGLPRPAGRCDPGAVQRGRPAIATSAGSARYVQPQSGVGPSVAIDPALVLSDAEPTLTGLASATVTIATNYRSAQDRLSFVNAGMGNIAADAFDTTSGRLTLRSAGAGATLAQWQAALRAVGYNNLAVAPTQADGALRGIAFAASDAWVAGDAATRDMRVNPLIRWSNDALPGATVGAPYTAALSANGGEGALTFSLDSGALPPGMTLQADGSLDGVPTTSAPYAFVAKATDAIGSTATHGYDLAVAKRTTTLTLGAAPNPAIVGEPIHLTATIAGTGPTGEVVFGDGAQSVCTATVTDSAAQCTVASLGTGAHALGASYGGDANHLGSNANSVVLTVRHATATTLASDCPRVVVEHQPLTIIASVSGTAPTGGVDFVADTLTLCSAVPVAGNVAVCTTSALAANAGAAQTGYALSAAYQGDANNGPSVSTMLAITVLSASERIFHGTFESAVSGCPLP